MGYKPYQAHRLAQTFRKHNRRVIRELFQHHLTDEKKYLSEAKKYASELEELLKTEKEDSSGYDLDCSWDVSSRREEIQKLQEDGIK
jgi:hypothetical protein